MMFLASTPALLHKAEMGEASQLAPFRKVNKAILILIIDKIK
jgi:hypothetical protein